MKARQKQIEDKIADIDALMTVIDTGKDAQGHRVIVNGVMMATKGILAELEADQC